MNLEITIDGEVQQPSLAERSLTHIQAISSRFVRGVGSMVTEAATKAYTELDLYDFDKKNNTHLYTQYKEQKRMDKVAHMAGKYGLVARDTVGRYV